MFCQRWSVVTTLLSIITFHLQLIWLQTLIVMDSESSLTSFPSFCTQPSEVAALFNSNLSRLPFLGQVINSVLLLCRVCTGFDLEHVFLFLCHIFTQRPKNDRKVERSDVCCLGQQQLLTNSIEISFHMKKKSDLSLPEIYKALKPC